MKIKEFELKPSLFINDTNYDELIKMYKIALKKTNQTFHLKIKREKYMQ